MNSIFSNFDNKIICSYIKKTEITKARIDMCHDDQTIQVGVKKICNGTKVQAHKHNKIERSILNTQETWIVISGTLKAEVFDVDDNFLSSIILHEGDCIVFFLGGHSMEALEDNTIFYEIKNGPYFGVENDKQYI